MAASRSDMGRDVDWVITALEERLERTREKKKLREYKTVDHEETTAAWFPQCTGRPMERTSSWSRASRRQVLPQQRNPRTKRRRAAIVAEKHGKGSRAGGAAFAAEDQMLPANSRASEGDSVKVISGVELAHLRLDDETLRIKLDKVTGEVRNAQRADEELRIEGGNQKQHRDAWLKRALSNSGINLNRGNRVSGTLSKLRLVADREESWPMQERGWRSSNRRPNRPLNSFVRQM